MSTTTTQQQQSNNTNTNTNNKSPSTSGGAGRKLDFTGNIFAGSVAGFLSTCVTNPFDTLKTRMGASREGSGVASKTLLCHVKALFADGFVKGLSVGLKANLLSSVPSNAIYLTSYKMINASLHENIGDHGFFVPVGSAAGAVCMTNGTLSPFFTIRTRVMLDNTATVGSIARSIMAADGPRGFYRGALTNTAGRFVEEGTFWLLYEAAMRYQRETNTTAGALHSDNFLWSTFMILGASASCKIVGSTISYPYNVVMTHLREVDKTTNKHNHTKIGDTIRFIYRNDGIPGFWKGITPHLIRCALSKSLQIYFFEVGAMAWATTQKIRGKQVVYETA